MHRVSALLLAFLLILVGSVRGQEIRVVADDERVATASVTAVEKLALAAFRSLAPNFPHTRFRPIAVHLHSSGDALGQELRRALHPGTAGCALLGRDEIHLMLREALRNENGGLEAVVKHELVHVLLDQHAGAGGPFLPRWLHEGLAQALSESGYLDASEETLVFRAATDTLIDFRDLVDDFPRDDEMLLRLAYRQSWSWVVFLQRYVGLDVILKAARESSQKLRFHQVLSGELGHGLLPIQERWVDWLIHESGAPWRALMRNTFEFCMLLTVPIFFLAFLRKRRREQAIRDRLARADEAFLDDAETQMIEQDMEGAEQRP